MEEDLDFFFNNNASQSKTRKYKTKKIKQYNMTKRNFLTNISYNRVKEEGFWGQKFCF